MSSYSLTILGTDIVGLTLAQKISKETNPEDLALIGKPPTENQIENLEYLIESSNETVSERFPPAFENAGDVQTVMNDVVHSLDKSLEQFGNTLIDLDVNTDGFSMLVQTPESELESIHSRYLLTTAPAILDIVENAMELPGTDSAVTGLLIDRTGLSLKSSENFYFITQDSTSRLWDFDFGFETEEHGATTNLRIFAAGQCAYGSISPDRMKFLVDELNDFPDPYEHYKNPFDTEGWQDVSMPEGFVDTKLDRLRELLHQLINDTVEDTDSFIQTMEGLAGEIDSYSRFRPDPDLKRLRWKTLTAMNLTRSCLLEHKKINA